MKVCCIGGAIHISVLEMLNPGSSMLGKDGERNDGLSVWGDGHVEGVPKMRDECILPEVIDQDALVKGFLVEE